MDNHATNQASNEDRSHVQVCGDYTLDKLTLASLKRIMPQYREAISSELSEALSGYNRGLWVTDRQVVVLDEAHRLFVEMYRAFDPSPNLRINQEQFTRLRERRNL